MITDEKKEIIPPVTIAEFMEVLPILYRAKEVPVLVISHTGVGKTQSVHKFCETHHLSYKNIRLSYIEAQDIVGFPQVKNDRMVYIQPDFLPVDPKSRGILFFDEINRARLDVLQAVFQLILERELGVGSISGETYQLPENWFIIASQNPDTDEYYVSPMDEALFNRFLIIPVEYDEHIYKEFITASGDTYDPVLSGFIREEGVKIADKNTRNIEVHPTPRSFELFNKVLTHLLPGEYHLLPIIGNGLIGPENFKKFALYRSRNDDQVKALLSDILAGRFETSPQKEKIPGLEKEKFETVIGAIDRFIALYIREEHEFMAVSQNAVLHHFLNFSFHLSNEQIVSTLLGIRKGLEQWGGGHKYLPVIEEMIRQHPESGDKYNAVLKSYRKLNLDEFI